MGLVSKINNGCHKDMDYKLFKKSSLAIENLLKDIIKNIDKIKDFNDLKKIGYKNEKEMFLLTKNINTHKGLIFCTSVYFYCLLKFKPKDLKSHIKNISLLCKNIKKEYGKSQSIGDELYRKYKILGAKYQAYKGYKIIYKALNYYHLNIVKKDIDKSLKLFLLLGYISIKIKDTTLINKIGLKKYKLYKKKIKILLCSYKEEEIYNFNKWCIENNASPGGSADIFVLLLFTNMIVIN